MKLLFDQNLSFKLCSGLSDIYPGSMQARLIGMDGAADGLLWDYARENSITLVTQDADFSCLSRARGWPPKVIWLRCGNQPTRFVARLLRLKHREIKQFSTDPDLGVPEIRERIAVFVSRRGGR